MDQSPNRRQLLVALGGVVVAGAGAVLPAISRARNRKTATDDPATGNAVLANGAGSSQAAGLERVEIETATVRQLIAPLAVGSVIGDAVIVAVHGVSMGAATVALRAKGGWSFQVDICRRDNSPGAFEAVASTQYYDLFLANGGSGAKPTDQGPGIAARALAEVIAAQEGQAPRLSVLSLRDRLQKHTGAVFAVDWAAAKA